MPCRGALKVDVEGRLDPQAVVQDPVALELLEEETADFLGEVSRDAEVFEIRVAPDDRRDVDLAVVDLLGDVSVAQHPAEHVAALIVRGVEVAARVVRARTLNQPGEHRGFETVRLWASFPK